MKLLAVGCSLLALVACSSAPPFVPPSSTGSSTGGSSTAGANGTTGSSTGSSTGPVTSSGSSAGSSTGRKSSSTGSSTGGSSTGGRGTTTGSYIGLPCTFDSVTGVDSCEPYGYECSTEYDTMDPGTCVLPQELAECQPDVGCQPGGSPALVCAAGFINSGNNIDLCAYPCKTTQDCASVREICIPPFGDAGPICFYDRCDSNPQTGKLTPPFFNRCTVDDAGDTGQCLPLGPGPAVALCFQNGFDFTGEACNVDGRVGPYSQCDFGDFCVVGTDAGTCLPISVDGGCPSGYDAYKLTPDWDVCGLDCTQTGPPGCPYGTCYWTDATQTVAVCL